MEFEFIKEVVKPDCKVKGKYSGIVEEWLSTDNKTLKFSCKDMREKKNVYWSVCSYRRTHNYDYTVYAERGTYNVYLVR